MKQKETVEDRRREQEIAERFATFMGFEQNKYIGDTRVDRYLYQPKVNGKAFEYIVAFFEVKDRSRYGCFDKNIHDIYVSLAKWDVLMQFARLFRVDGFYLTGWQDKIAVIHVDDILKCSDQLKIAHAGNTRGECPNDLEAMIIVPCSVWNTFER